MKNKVRYLAYTAAALILALAVLLLLLRNPPVERSTYVIDEESSKVIESAYTEHFPDVNITYITTRSEELALTIYNYSFNSLLTSGYQIVKRLGDNSVLLLGKYYVLIGLKERTVIVVKGSNSEDVLKAWEKISPG